LRIARLTRQHGKTVGLPLGPHGFISATRQQRLRQGVEEEGGVFAEAGEIAGGVVAGKGIDEVGGGLPYLECLVHGSGLTLFVIVVSDSGGAWRGEKSLGANNQFRKV